MAELTHLDENGNARMVDVSEKTPTSRRAVATGCITLGAEARAALHAGTRKGDVLTIAQIAGITGAKKTSDLIPLCHPLPLSACDVTFEVSEEGVRCWAAVRTTGRTGVEMEALTAVSVALLTVYDMLKAVDRSMTIGGVSLEEKSGGRSGHWTRPS